MKVFKIAGSLHKMTETPVRPLTCDVDSTPVQTNIALLQKRRELRKNIKQILLRFKFNELITDVILGLFELEPEEVKQKLNELKLPYSKDSLATLLSSRSQAFSIQDLEDMYHSLLLHRTAFGSKQKRWMPVNLLEPTEDHTFLADQRATRLNILQALRIKGLNAVVKVIIYNELIWVMIIEKKLTRRNGMKLLTPIFFCYEVGTPYIFTASKIPEVTLECILRSMKYRKHKLQQLEGKDIKSLLGLLKHKTMNGRTHVVPYAEAQVKAGHRYVDLSKKMARESYINRVFDTKDPIHLETFQANAEAIWRDSELVPEMRGEPFQVTLTLKSKDLVGMVKHMVSNDMVNTPLPDYLQMIVRSAKNKVSMKTVGNSK